jgi:hypothetical protein
VRPHLILVVRQMMKNISTVIVALIALLPVSASYAHTDTFCKTIRLFADSIKPNDNRSIEFHTSWGSNFKDSPDPAVYAKRCLHNEYAPAKAVCDYLMKYGSTEFSSRNAERAIICLFPKTQLDSMLSLNKIDASFSYGKDNRSSIINISFNEARDVGGMVLKITAEGY